jgi:DNA-binding MarR family transcriptional regulator
VTRTQRQVGTPEGNIVLDLFVLHQRIGELMDLALSGSGVRPAEYAVYSQLADGALTPGELCARLGVTPSTLTGHLRALSERGHISRTRDPADGRSYQVDLTASGRRTLEQSRAGFRRMLRELNDSLPADPAQVRTVLSTLDETAAQVIERWTSRRDAQLTGVSVPSPDPTRPADE